MTLPSSTSASANPSSPPTPPRRHRRNRWLRLLGWLAGGALAVVLLVGGYLQTGLGKAQLTRLASRQLSAATGMTVRVEQLSGFLPVDMTVGRFSMADADGVFLAVKDFQLAWSPLALLRGRIVVRTVAADIIRLRRLPPSAPEPEPKKPTPVAWPPQIPSLPPILLDSLRVNQLILDAPVVGQETVLALSAHLSESGQGNLVAKLAIDRQGDRPLHVHLDSALNHADWRLTCNLQVTDVAGGLLSSALLGPNGGPVSLSLTGEGPLTDWKGHLAANLADQPTLTADLGLGVPLDPKGDTAFRLSLAAMPPHGVLPDWGTQLARLTGDRLTVDAAGHYGIVSGAFTLQNATIRAAVGTLDATAALNPTANTLAARVKLHVPDASRLDPSISGVVDTQIDVSGALKRPVVTLSAKAKQFRADPIGLDAATITTKAVLAGDLADAFPGAQVTIAGSLTGLSGPEGTTLLGRDLTLKGAAAISKAGAITANTVDLIGQGGSMQVSGGLAADGTITGNLKTTIRNLAGLASLGGLALTGQAALTAKVTRAPSGAGKGEVQLKCTQLASPEKTGNAATVAALLGSAPDLSLRMDMTPAAINLSRLALTGKALKLAGSGNRNMTNGQINAKLTAELPDLAALSPALGQNAAGKATISASVTGTQEMLLLQTQTRVLQFVLGETRLDEILLKATASDLARQPTSHVSLSARRDAETASLETDAKLAGQILTVSKLQLTAPKTNFSGQLQMDLAKKLFSGRLSGASTDLSGLGRFAGVGMAGSLELSVTASTGRQGQSVVTTLTAKGLKAGTTTAKKLSLSAHLDDVLGRPRGQADLTANSLHTDALDLTKLTLALRGDGRKLTAHTKTNGHLANGKALAVDTTVRLDESGKGRVITVTSLSGTLDKRPFSLHGPTTVTLSGATMRLQGLSLRLDKATLTGSAELTPRSLNGKLALSHFPLPLLTTFDLPGIDGTASLKVDLSGSPAHPKLTATTELDAIKLGSAKGRSLPPMTAKATVALAGGTGSATVALAGSNKKAIVTVQAGIPVRFALSPTTFAIAPNAPLSGHVKADGDLNDVAALLAQANTLMTGRLKADLTVSGTLSAPSLLGSVHLNAKRLENADSGIVLRNLDLAMEASGTKLTITKGTASDLKGGKLAITGSVGPLAGGDAPIGIDVTLKELKVAGLDLATVTADGSINISGSLNQMKVNGALTIGPADINIPTSMPPSVVVIPVTMVNDPNAKPAPPRHGPPAAAHRLDLDLKIRLGRSVYVRGMGLDSRWTGELAIFGTGDDPRGRGRLSVNRGRVELFGSDLEITKGEVFYDGQSLSAPQLIIRASNTVDDVTAGVSLTGDAANPTIALFSDPTLSDDEILSRILFGKSVNTLSPLQAVQLAQAAATLYSGGAPTSVLARTRRALGLDELSLSSGSDSESNTSAVIKAGKEVVEGVTVNVEQGTAAQSGAVSVEVKVSSHITVESRVGEDDQQSVGVNWKWDY